jgi:hypothetical protein
MNHFYYSRHFALLAVAVVLTFLIGHWDLFGEPFLPTFALNGALHASALVLALRERALLVRKCLFVALAAALCIVTLYIGIASLQLFAVLPSTERLYAVLSVCSAVGAITYGTLIRFFWMKKFSSRFVLAIALACAAGAMLAFLIASQFKLVQGWWLTAAWWFVFSGALWYFDTHRGGPSIHTQ